MVSLVESHADVSPRAASKGTPAAAMDCTLDTLAQFDATALEALFHDAKPATLHAVLGHPRGRVLAIPRRDTGRVAVALRALHASSLWPWEGKSFAAAPGATQGAGINRVRLPFRAGLFSFRTYETSSVVDGRPCLAIDYNVEHGPRAARPIYDELREVGDGVYLGRGMRRGPRGPKLVLWFGLDTGIQDVPVRIPPASAPSAR
jgi:hypothetical protein